MPVSSLISGSRPTSMAARPCLRVARVVPSPRAVQARSDPAASAKGAQLEGKCVLRIVQDICVCAALLRDSYRKCQLWRMRMTIVWYAAIEVTDKTFQKLVLENPLPVCVDFWAPWCGPCRMIAPIIDQIADNFEGQVVCVRPSPEVSQTAHLSFSV